MFEPLKSMTRGEFAALVRKVKDSVGGTISDEVLEELASDLQYVLELALHFPEKQLEALEHPAIRDGSFW